MAPARRDLLRMLAIGGAVGTATQILPTQSASAATSATTPPAPSGDSSGVTDTRNIQAQLDAAAAAGGGVVVLAAGGQYIVKGLSIDTLVALDLSGSTLTLAANANSSVLQSKGFASLTGSDSTAGPTDFEIRNGYLDGNKSGQSSTSNPVLAIYGRRYIIDNLVIRNGGGVGFSSQWSDNSAYLGPNGFESYATRLYVHDCDGDGINFQGPHDTFFHTFFITKCSTASGAVPLRLPASDDRSSGSNFEQFHIYGGGGYAYGLLANSSGMKFTSFVVEGAQIAQILIQASQVKMDGFHLYSGNIATDTVKGIQIGDSTHAGTNGVWLRGVIEGLGGGALDVTYAGDHNNIDLSHYVYSQVPDTSGTGYGVVGTLTPLNTFHLDIIGPDFTKTVACEHSQHGRTTIRRTSAGDGRAMLALYDETSSPLQQFDRYGRLVPGPAMGRPTVAAQAAGAGSGATASIAGTDMSGRVSVTTGTSPTAATLAVLTFGHAWLGTVSSPRVMLQPANIATARLGVVSTESPTATQFAIRPVSAPSARTVYAWDYVVTG